jgi:hypothetical protein
MGDTVLAHDLKIVVDSTTGLWTVLQDWDTFPSVPDFNNDDTQQLVTNIAIQLSDMVLCGMLKCFMAFISLLKYFIYALFSLSSIMYDICGTCLYTSASLPQLRQRRCLQQKSLRYSGSTTMDTPPFW